jgi:TRAP transporter TAXI family solute receptor
MSISRRGLLAAAFASVAATHGGSAQAQGSNYILATATTGGTYYPVGVALATLTKVRLEPSTGIGMSAISSAGSGENVRLLRENEAQFALLAGLYGYYAVNGVGPLEEEGQQENVRSIVTVWSNVEHFIIDNSHLNTGTMADFLAMKGETVNLGAQNSGALGIARTLMANAGLDIDTDFNLVYSGYGPAAEQLQNGQIAAASLPAGPPVGAVTQLMAAASDRVTVLDVTDEELQMLDGGFNLWTRYVIPAGTYPGQEEDINTMGQPNFLAVNADVPEEDVYQITKTIFENLGFLQAIHPATGAISLDAAINGLPAPLHPGAVRYYREQGIEIPDRLIAD